MTYKKTIRIAEATLNKIYETSGPSCWAR